MIKGRESDNVESSDIKESSYNRWIRVVENSFMGSSLSRIKMFMIYHLDFEQIIVHDIQYLLTGLTPLVCIFLSKVKKAEESYMI